MKKLILLLILCSNACFASTKLNGFSSKLVSKKKPPRKVYKAQAQKAKKPRIIQDAVIWQVPSHKALAKKLSSQEKIRLDEASLEIIITGLRQNNTRFQEAETILGKRQFLALSLISSLLRDSEIATNLNNNLSSDKQEAQRVIQQLSQEGYRYYKNYCKIYQEREERDLRLLRATEAAASKLVAVTDERTLLEIEQLWRRE